MPRERLRAFWWSAVLMVVLSAVAVLVELLAPESDSWARLALLAALLLVPLVAWIRYRPRPWTPVWTGPTGRGGLAEIENGESFATPARRAAALDRARRAVWPTLLQILAVWPLQAAILSRQPWSPLWFQLICLAVVVGAAYALWRVRRRIVRIDRYDDTVPVAGPHPATDT